MIMARRMIPMLERALDETKDFFYKKQGIKFSDREAQAVFVHRAKRNPIKIQKASKKRNKITASFGFTTDGIVAIASVFLFVITLLVVGKMFTSVEQSFVNSSMFDNETKEMVTTQEGNFYSIFDFVALFLLVGMLIAMIVSALFIRTHPIFFFVIVFVFVLTAFMGALFTNVFESVAGSSGFSDVADRLPLTEVVMNNLPYFGVVALFVMVVVLYAKFRMETGGGMSGF